MSDCRCFMEYGDSEKHATDCPVFMQERIAILEAEGLDTLPAHIIADVVTDVDGFKYFWPRNNGGHFAAHHLRKIAMYLDKVNEKQQKHLEEYFEDNE